jgi:hypothetical protein
MRVVLRRAWLSLFWCAGFLLMSGCGGAQFDGSVYRASDLKFRVGPTPASWRRIELDEARLSFRDDAQNATILVNGRCGVDNDDVPLTSLTQHLFINFTERAPVSQRELLLDGRAALRTETVAALDGVRKHYTVFVLKKNGCVYDFVDVAAGEPSAEARAEFEQFVHGFATIE